MIVANPSLALVVVGLSVVLIAPAEELLFRAAIRGRLRSAFGTVPAVVGASTLFGAWHLLNVSGSLLGAVLAAGVIGVVSLLWVDAYERTDNVAVPVLIHGLYNLTLIPFAYLQLWAHEGPHNTFHCSRRVSDVSQSDPAETTAQGDAGQADDPDRDADAARSLADLPPTDERPIVLFDGVCNLCNSLVQFVVERDADATLRLASLQSPVGQALLERHGLPTDDYDTFVLIEDGEAYTRSEAALRAASYLDRPYPLFRHLLAVPRPVRDLGYDLVARFRYDVFGRADQCMVPTGDTRERFLDDGVGPTE